MKSPSQIRLNQEQRRAKTRKEILEIARKHFALNGFRGASTESIAEAAGYSRGAFHYNFKNKEELFIEVMRTSFAEDFQNLKDLFAAFSGDLTAIATAAFVASANQPNSYLLRLEFWMRALRDDTFRAVYLNEHRLYRAALVELGKSHNHPSNPDLAALTMGLHNGLEMIHLLDPQEFTVNTYQQLFDTIIVATSKSEGNV
jgi:AcrR family transcriptional regulator